MTQPHNSRTFERTPGVVRRAHLTSFLCPFAPYPFPSPLPASDYPPRILTSMAEDTRDQPQATEHLSQSRRIVLDAPSWLPIEKFPQKVVIGSLLIFVLVVV